MRPDHWLAILTLLRWGSLALILLFLLRIVKAYAHCHPFCLEVGI